MVIKDLDIDETQTVKIMKNGLPEDIKFKVIVNYTQEPQKMFTHNGNILYEDHIKIYSHINKILNIPILTKQTSKQLKIGINHTYSTAILPLRTINVLFDAEFISDGPNKKGAYQIGNIAEGNGKLKGYTLFDQIFEIYSDRRLAKHALRPLEECVEEWYSLPVHYGYNGNAIHQKDLGTQTLTLKELDSGKYR